MTQVPVRERILVVEDDPEMAELLKIRLSSAGFQVHTEGRGLPALDYAEKNELDLAILDLKLPDIHGYEVCKRLRLLCNPKFLPVIMLTGMDRPMDQLRGFSYGADAYLVKPYHWAELLKMIEMFLGYQDAGGTEDPGGLINP